MLEHIVQMGPMLVLAGLIAGWVAEAASRAGGYGFILDMVLGLTGSVVVGSLVWVLISSGIGMPVMLMIGYSVAAFTSSLLGLGSIWREIAHYCHPPPTPHTP